MKVGSLVECIKPPVRPCWIDGVTQPAIGGIYTVREIRFDWIISRHGILVEEIHNPCEPIDGLEWGFVIERFREVQPPMDLSFIESIQQPQIQSL